MWHDQSTWKHRWVKNRKIDWFLLEEYETIRLLHKSMYEKNHNEKHFGGESCDVKVC